YPSLHFFFCFTHPATTEFYTLSLHDALPISVPHYQLLSPPFVSMLIPMSWPYHLQGTLLLRSQPTQEINCHTMKTCALCPQHSRSEEHTSELQSPCNLVCRLLLEKKKIKHTT